MRALHVHFRVPYLRPDRQGGDTQQPLCQTPAVGWAGPDAARLAMTDDARRVDCGHCRAELAAGGLSARLATARVLRR